MKRKNPLPVGRGFKFSIKHLVRQHPKRFPRGEGFGETEKPSTLRWRAFLHKTNKRER